VRVLVVHNRYSSRTPSGENLAVDDEARWLVDAGVDVVRHEVTNDDMVDVGPLARARDGLGAVWSLPARRRFAAVLDDARPDVVHVHNLFPLLSGSVPALARRRGVPVAWTVHNRRVRCVAGTNFRDGRPCHDCRPGWRVPGVVHRCYASSVSASVLVTAATGLFLRSARAGGVAPIAISSAVADWVVGACGFDRGAVRVKYNGVAGPPSSASPPPAPCGSRTFLYAGRLSSDKGVPLLLDAWKRAGVAGSLELAGDGPAAPAVRAAAAADPRITWLGQLAPDEVAVRLAAARAVVVPSLWDEPFGRVAAEALAYGRPVITTGRGALGEIVDDHCGWVCGPSTDALAGALSEAAASDAAVASRGGAARAVHEARFSPQVTTARLLEIYEELRR
jgi:glycosyltransferase involved in cell wall biosynthesis